MSPAELRAGASLAGVFGLRMLGLFLILPVFAVHAPQLAGGDNLTLVGLALGAYGLSQAILQIPFGMASDRWGRKPVIYIGLVVLPLSSGAFARAFTAFLSFAVAMGGLMMLLTVCIGLSKRTLLQHLVASTITIRKVSGGILILIGLYLGYYFLRAGM